MRYNAMEERFEEIEVLGKPALFHDMRLERNTIPKGLYLYEVRYDDDGVGNPVQIAKGIMVNHLGSIITREPLPLDVYKRQGLELCRGRLQDGKAIYGKISTSQKEK